jgi:hypothetical protein
MRFGMRFCGSQKAMPKRNLSINIFPGVPFGSSAVGTFAELHPRLRYRAALRRCFVLRAYFAGANSQLARFIGRGTASPLQYKNVDFFG